jgi:type IV pilus assembly protein PilA
MKNFKKSAKGFTLVELIVVIAIIGVLAAILVPAMMGWIAKANMQSANAGAKEIYQTAQAIAQDYEQAGQGLLSYYTNQTASGTNASFTLVFRDEMVRKMADSKDASWAVMFCSTGTQAIDTGTCIGAAFAKAGNNDYVGTYPKLPDRQNGKASMGNVASGVSAAATKYATDASVTLASIWTTGATIGGSSTSPAAQQQQTT